MTTTHTTLCLDCAQPLNPELREIGVCLACSRRRESMGTFSPRPIVQEVRRDPRLDKNGNPQTLWIVHSWLTGQTVRVIDDGYNPPKEIREGRWVQIPTTHLTPARWRALVKRSREAGLMERRD
jgi:hypothetical protein